MGICWCKSGHGLPFAKPTRVPPDPTLFPNYIQNAQGLWLRHTSWWPRREVPIRGIVVIVSGLGEHSGRYDSVALRFTDAGYVCFSMDNQGAGGSEGLRLYVERFSHFVDDIQLFVYHLQMTYPDLTKLPWFLLGHSMGGLIATHVALRDPSFFAGVILSGPAYAPGKSARIGAFSRALLGCLSNCFPRMPVSSLDVNAVSHNGPVVQLVKQDPFYCSAKLRARFGAELLLAQKDVFAKMDCSTFPFLIVHGEEDYLCCVTRAKDFYNAALSTDKHIKTYPHAYHEVLTELCRQTVMDDIIDFVETHTKTVLHLGDE